MKKLIYIFLMIPVAVCGQFSDDFTNGNFTEDPAWQGDHDKFIVDQGMLRLYDDEAGVAWLSTQSHVIHNTQWDFWVRLAFTPSDNNYPRIYLVSDQPALDGPLQGYFIRIGKTGSDMKRLFFCRQDGTEITTLLSGNMNLATTTNNLLRIRVVRDGLGHWAFYADPGGGSLYIPQGQVFDHTYTSTSWFGVHCTYTVSNSRRFYFDDFRVGDITPEDPLSVEKLQVVSPNTLDVTFNRVVTAETALLPQNYMVDQGVGHPLIASADPEFPHMVRLLFFNHFEQNRLYNVQISGISAMDGEIMEPFQGEFVHYVSNRFDVVFNEIMANSRPVVALPPHDWLELYNTTDIPIDLAGWTLQHGTTQRLIPEAVIPPGGYLVLTGEAAHPDLAPYGNVVAVPGLSATALTIGGTCLMLKDHRGELVSFVDYSDRWYRDGTKAQGGWSLEKIDPYNFCQGAENWRASEDPKGGTPAATNSVRGDNPNTVSPRLLRAGYVDSLTVRLHFSEPMNEASLVLTDHFYIDQGIGHPLSAKAFMPAFSVAEITLDQALTEGIVYNIEVSDHLSDCAGNLIDQNSARVSVPVHALAGDVVLNEILFNPPPGGARYVEVFNRSDNVFDLKDMLLTSKDTIEHVLTTIQYVSDESHLVFPGDYVVFTSDTGAVKKFYQVPDPDVFVELQAMPRMTISDGIVVLAGRNHQIIDMLAYTSDMHLPLLADLRGVALERIHPDRPAQEPSSWHSAASSAAYGTPGYRNSQFVAYHNPFDAEFYVDPPVFSPNGSGANDVLNIYYSLDQPGYVAHVRVFDRRGREVKTLARAKLLATSGVLTWDGTTNDRQKASIGMYVVHVLLFNQYGQVAVYRLAAVLAAD